MDTESPIVVPISAIEHHVYCPRQCALIHVDGVWADNRFTVRGARAHRRVDEEGRRRERGRMALRSVPLWSESLGLSGRADVIEIYRGGEICPVEHKSGVRHGLTADMQLCAQGMCLEEMLGVEVRRGWVWYGGPRRRVEVVFDEELRKAVAEVVAEIRSALESGELPPAPNDTRCRNCQLVHHCLPGLSGDPSRVSAYLREEGLACAT